jgi:glutamate 5-kinase
MEYRAEIKDCKSVVIKIGTTSLTYQNGKINIRQMDRLARVIADIRNRGIEVVLVSSGAIAVGTDRLGLKERPRDTINKQAASAVGQATLMQMYEKLFEEYNQKVAQILLTKPVFESDLKKNNARNTISCLLKMGVIPIVNENDTVATDELNDFSDNDTLSSYVAELIDTDLLVILSDIKGMYTADPNKNPDAKIIDIVNEVDDEIYSLAGGSASSLGTGGMVTKVKAADFLTKKGINMIIASGEDPYLLFDILDGKQVGTLFLGR